MSNYEYVRENYSTLLSEVEEYERRFGRSITVVAVTKSGTDEELLALAEAGVTDVGENRPTELARRGKLLKENGYSPRLHEIGNLQRNKVKLVIGEASLIHSVGKYELAEEISRQAVKLGITAPVLIEVNSANEPLKGGVAPENTEALFLKIRELPGISVKGLMTMGPAVSDPEELRKYFRLTKKLFDKFGGDIAKCYVLTLYNKT